MKNIKEYFDLNKRHEEAILRKSLSDDPRRLRALGDNDEEAKRNPYKLSHQIIMYLFALIGLILEKAMTQYLSDQSVLLIIPNKLEIAFYAVVSFALMPAVYSRLAFVGENTPMVVQIGWSLLYGFFSRPVLNSMFNVIKAGIKASN